MIGAGAFRLPVWYVALDAVALALLAGAAFLWSQGASTPVWALVGAAGLALTTYTGVRLFRTLKSRLEDGE